MNGMDLVKDKWAQSGWKIEQKYGNKVLLGNWAEDRLQFTRELKIADSSSRRDYQPHWDFRPDVSARRSSLMRAESIKKATGKRARRIYPLYKRGVPSVGQGSLVGQHLAFQQTLADCSPSIPVSESTSPFSPS